MIGDTVAHVLPTLAVPLEVAMLELDPSTLRRLGEEAHLDLAGLREISL